MTQKKQHYSEVQREGVLEWKSLILHRSMCRGKADGGVNSEPRCIGDVSAGKREIAVFCSVLKRNILLIYSQLLP